MVCSQVLLRVNFAVHSATKTSSISSGAGRGGHVPSYQLVAQGLVLEGLNSHDHEVRKDPSKQVRSSVFTDAMLISS